MCARSNQISAENGKSTFLDLQYSVGISVAEKFDIDKSKHSCSFLVEDMTFPEQFGVTSQVTDLQVNYKNFRHNLCLFSITKQTKTIQLLLDFRKRRKTRKR